MSNKATPAAAKPTVADPYPVTALLFGNEIGNKIVTIEVGVKGSSETFSVHKDLLCKKAPIFDKMFNGPFKEGQTQLSKLPEDNIHVFKLFLGWLYLGIIEIPSTQFFVDYSHLYAFADKYCISELADATMDKMCKVSAHKKWMPTESEITVCYELTPRKSKLSLFFARCLAWVSLHISGDRADKLWTNEGLRDTVKGNDDLSLQFFDLLRFQSGKPLPDPREAPACDYHQHTKDEPCPYIKQ